MDLNNLEAILNFAALIVFECLFTVAAILVFFGGEALLATSLFFGAFVIFVIYFKKKILQKIEVGKKDFIL